MKTRGELLDELNAAFERAREIFFTDRDRSGGVHAEVPIFRGRGLYFGWGKVSGQWDLYIRDESRTDPVMRVTQAPKLLRIEAAKLIADLWNERSEAAERERNAIEEALRTLNLFCKGDE